jgi:RimK-like ATP-grasp domain
MIVAIGVDVDDPFARFVKGAVAAEVPLRMVNLRAAVEGDWRFEVPARGPAVLRHDGQLIELQPDDAFFCRLIDLSSQAVDPHTTRRWHGLMVGLRAWLADVPGKVVNRGLAGAHNSSKPLHEAVLQELGFSVPESITGCDPQELRRFVRDGPTVSKTVCGVRAQTTAVTEAELDGFVPESGPIHLQRLVKGADARIHVIGDTVVAQRLSADTVDYRRGGAMDDLEVFELPAPLRDLVIDATRRIGLAFAGWDFKIDSDDRYWCLEVNPMPGYSPYDLRCDGAITQALLRYLGAEVPARDR